MKLKLIEDFSFEMTRTDEEELLLLNKHGESDVLSDFPMSDEENTVKMKVRLLIVLILSLIFLFIGIFGGLWSNSLAIVTDAANTFVDAAGFLLSLISIHLASKKPSTRFSFGYVRAEVLGALVNILTLWLITGILLRLALERVLYRDFKILSLEMIIVAMIGISVDLLMFLVLHGDSFVQSIVNRFSSKRNDVSMICSDNINIRAVTIHIIGDLLQGVGDLFAGILIYFKPEYKIADPICTFVFSFIAIVATFPLLRDIVLILMEGVPSHLSFREISDDLSGLSGVDHIHHLRLWSLSTKEVALSVHLSIKNVDQSQVLTEARELLQQNYQITRTAIQIEHFDDEIIKSCLSHA